ncbi:MAG: dipeptidase [Candidatus Hydrogenedentes bacterium]|nr:dipeptidase [Candidatus Hydrogenedentota bacterium]
MSTLDGALKYASGHEAAFLAEYQEFLRIPSISTLPENKADVQRAAEWVAGQLKRLKMDHVELFPTGGHPILYGECLKAPGQPTVLVYGHYDVQPVDPVGEWESDPFGAEVRGDYIYARGASDMKGQIFAQLKAMESLLQAGAYPVNVKYLLEGEEEIGSVHLPEFIDAHRDLLRCDVVLNCDAGIHAPDQPAITYSLRGLAYFELEVRTAKRDLHSGLFGGSVRNPIHVLCELITGMHDTRGRVTLPGFYDKVRPLDDEERALLQQVPYTDTQWLELTGADMLYGEAGYSSIERIGARPTLDVNGIWGGFTGEGAKTVLPAKATAKLSTRLVADQDLHAVEGQLREYIQTHLPEGVQWELHVHSTGPGATMDRKSAFMQAAARALEEVFGVAPIYKREGGSVPVVAMLQQKLGVDSIMLGFALPDDGIHGPNEKQYLPNFYRGINTYIRFLSLLQVLEG